MCMPRPDREPRITDDNGEGIFDLAAAPVGSRHDSLTALTAGFSWVGRASEQTARFVTTMVRSVESEAPAALALHSYCARRSPTEDY